LEGKISCLEKLEKWGTVSLFCW